MDKPEKKYMTGYGYVYNADEVAEIATEVLPHLINQRTVISFAGQRRLESLIYKVEQIVKEERGAREVLYDVMEEMTDEY